MLVEVSQYFGSINEKNTYTMTNLLPRFYVEESQNSLTLQQVVKSICRKICANMLAIIIIGYMKDM